MDFLSTMKAKAKADKKIIVLPESYEIRNLEAAAECLRDELAEIVLIGNKEKIMEAAFLLYEKKNSLGLFWRIFV